MINTPIIKNLPLSLYNFILFMIVTFVYMSLCAEVDIYIPSFTQMISYFGVEENQIQLTISLNLAILSISGLVTGPLSDAYGRRKTLLMGMVLFLISSLGCVLSHDFSTLLVWRALQGVTAAFPMVIVGATFYDHFSTEKAARYIGLSNGLISVFIVGAPILGAFISLYYGWRGNFLAIFLMVCFSFLLIILFLEETKSGEKKYTFNIVSIWKTYLSLLSHPTFIIFLIMANLPFICITVYIANSSVILVNHIGLTLESFAYYQAATMSVFIIFSFFTNKLIAMKGTDFSQNLGIYIMGLGALSILWVGASYHMSAFKICCCISLISAGGALLTGVFNAKAMAIFPDNKGSALAMIAAARQILTAILISICEIYFDGTIFPVSLVISVSILFSFFMYGVFLLHSILLIKPRINLSKINSG
jgi:MFS transporter, DHA1 family, multidrug resistance protein